MTDQPSNHPTIQPSDPGDQNQIATSASGRTRDDDPSSPAASQGHVTGAMGQLNNVQPTDWSIATDAEVMDADLVLELGLQDIPAEHIKTMLETMAAKVDEAALMRVLATVPEAKRPELEALVDKEDATGIKAFIEATVPGYDELVAEELVRFKRIMLTETPEEKQAAAQAAAAQRAADVPGAA